MPVWADELELHEFGDRWGPVGDSESLWLCGKQAFARWKILPGLGEAELLRIAVEKNHRRSGLAKLLMEESQNYLAGTGVGSAHLEVRDSNISAKGLYESMGWQQIGARKAYYKDGEYASVYRLILAHGK
jgi:ribosomal protein S18 acetylase RimI-like enzyme